MRFGMLCFDQLSYDTGTTGVVEDGGGVCDGRELVDEDFGDVERCAGAHALVGFGVG